MDAKSKIPKEVVEELSLKERAVTKRIIKASYDGKQFSFKIPKKVAIELELKNHDKFEISIQEEKNIILRRV